MRLLALFATAVLTGCSGGGGSTSIEQKLADFDNRAAPYSHSALMFYDGNGDGATAGACRTSGHAEASDYSPEHWTKLEEGDDYACWDDVSNNSVTCYSLNNNIQDRTNFANGSDEFNVTTQITIEGRISEVHYGTHGITNLFADAPAEEFLCGEYLHYKEPDNIVGNWYGEIYAVGDSGFMELLISEDFVCNTDICVSESFSFPVIFNDNGPVDSVTTFGGVEYHVFGMLSRFDNALALHVVPVDDSSVENCLSECMAGLLVR